MAKRIALIILLLAGVAHAQFPGHRTDIALGNVTGVAKPIGSASIYVCTSTAAINLAVLPPCAPSVATYSDAFLAHPNGFPFAADVNGNYGYYVDPADDYVECIAASRFATKCSIVNVSLLGTTAGSVGGLTINSGKLVHFITSLTFTGTNMSLTFLDWGGTGVGVVPYMNGVFTNHHIITGDANSELIDSGFALTGYSGNTSTLASTSGVFTNGNCVMTDVNHNFVDAGGVCGGGGGAGTVNAGLVNHFPYYAAAGTAVSDLGTDFTYNAGTRTFASAAGAIWDFSAATRFKPPTGAGFAPTSLELGFDSTATQPVYGDGAASHKLPGVTGAPTNNHCAKFTVAGTNVLVADAGFGCGPNVRSITYLAGCDNCVALTASDTQRTFWRNNLGVTVTLTEVWCSTDVGTTRIQLQRDDGTPANILTDNGGAGLDCTTGGATGTISGAESGVASTNKLDFVMVTAPGTTHRVTVNIAGTTP